MNALLAADCGSTTTKVILIEKKDGAYRQTWRGEAPTTVEAPAEDVTAGLLAAVREIEELSGRKLIEAGKIISPGSPGKGADAFVSTSSAGGGLKMLVCGVAGSMSVDSAKKCALGAGAIILEALAANDGKTAHAKILRIQQLKPDIILLAGGTDGGAVSQILEAAELIAAARPAPRFAGGAKLPLIYAGNALARKDVARILGGRIELHVAENIRPGIAAENLEPARRKILELFLNHVMARAPGYGKLKAWAHAPILPTPAAVGRILELVGAQGGGDALAVDVGGATTDVFSIVSGSQHRSVSANLGVSFSIANLLRRAGCESITRWLPFPMEEEDLRDALKNKMIRPSTIPQTVRELMLEHAAAREAVRLAFQDHRRPLPVTDARQGRTISAVFPRTPETAPAGAPRFGTIIASGGLLAHAPRRLQTLMMLVDALEPEGITTLAVDSIFMLPHLGALRQINEAAAADVLHRDCLLTLGSCVAPRGAGSPGEKCFEFLIRGPAGRTFGGSLAAGDIRRLPLEGRFEITVRPARGFDFGAGKGKALTAKLLGGPAGILLDARGRPLPWERSPASRRERIHRWHSEIGLYPDWNHES